MRQTILINARAIANLEERNKGLIGELSKGKDSNWDPVALLVHVGEIEVKEAIDSLAKCLSVLHSKYIIYSQETQFIENYWTERVNELEISLIDIFDKNKIWVSYRGFSVDKKDYNPNSLLN